MLQRVPSSVTSPKITVKIKKQCTNWGFYRLSKSIKLIIYFGLEHRVHYTSLLKSFGCLHALNRMPTGKTKIVLSPHFTQVCPEASQPLYLHEFQSSKIILKQLIGNWSLWEYQNIRPELFHRTIYPKQSKSMFTIVDTVHTLSVGTLFPFSSR